MKTARWCTVHDSAWDAYDMCERAIIDRNGGDFDVETCVFARMELRRLW